MKKRALMLALVVSLITAALPAVALAQDQEIPENLEDQPIICTEGVDCPGDPRYVPPPGEEPTPDPEPPSGINLEQPEVALPGDEEPPPNPNIPTTPPKQVDEVTIAPPPPEEKTPSSSGSQTKSGGSSGSQANSGSGQTKVKAKELPRTGGEAAGTSLLALGAGTLLVGGGLALRRIAR